MNKEMKRLALAQLLGQTGAGLSTGTHGQAGANLAGQASNMAHAAYMKEQEKEAEKQRKSSGLGKLGSILGGTVGAFTPLGPVLGAAAGSALGGSAGYAAGGGGFDVGNTLGYGLQGAMGGLAGQGLQGMMPGAAGAAGGAAPAATQQAGQSTMKAGIDTLYGNAPYAPRDAIPPPNQGQLSAMGAEGRAAQFGRAPVQPQQQQGLLSRMVSPEGASMLSSQMSAQGGAQQGNLGGYVGQGGQYVYQNGQVFDQYGRRVY